MANFCQICLAVLACLTLSSSSLSLAGYTGKNLIGETSIAGYMYQLQPAVTITVLEPLNKGIGLMPVGPTYLSGVSRISPGPQALNPYSSPALPPHILEYMPHNLEPLRPINRAYDVNIKPKTAVYIANSAPASTLEPLAIQPSNILLPQTPLQPVYSQALPALTQTPHLSQLSQTFLKPDYNPVIPAPVSIPPQSINYLPSKPVPLISSKPAILLPPVHSKLNYIPQISAPSPTIKYLPRNQVQLPLPKLENSIPSGLLKPDYVPGSPTNIPVQYLSVSKTIPQQQIGNISPKPAPVLLSQPEVLMPPLLPAPVTSYSGRRL